MRVGRQASTTTRHWVSDENISSTIPVNCRIDRQCSLKRLQGTVFITPAIKSLGKIQLSFRSFVALCATAYFLIRFPQLPVYILWNSLFHKTLPRLRMHSKSVSFFKWAIYIVLIKKVYTSHTSNRFHVIFCQYSRDLYFNLSKVCS